jgi:RNA polymerase sigma-70 factor (ECF subfamily)
LEFPRLQKVAGGGINARRTNSEVFFINFVIFRQLWLILSVSSVAISLTDYVEAGFMNESADQGSPSPQFVQSLVASQSALYSFIVSLMGGVQDANDVLQEANMKLCRKWAEYDVNQPFLRWAYVFARFEVMAWRKRKQRSRLVLDDELLDLVAEELEQSADDADHRLALLENCLAKLPPRQRELLIARYARGEACQDIAARYARGVNSMAALFYRVRKALAKCVQSALGRKEFL